MNDIQLLDLYVSKSIENTILESPDVQQTLINLVQVVFTLRSIDNYHGLVNVVRSIQQPRMVKFTAGVWNTIALNMPDTYGHFKRICKLVDRLQHEVMFCDRPHIGHLQSMLNRYRLHISASWQYIDSRPRFMIPQTSATAIVTSELTPLESTISPPVYSAKVVKLWYDQKGHPTLNQCKPIRLRSLDSFSFLCDRFYHFESIPENILKNFLAYYWDKFQDEFIILQHYCFEK